MWAVLLAYWPSVRKHRWLFVVGSLCMGLTIALHVWHPFLLRALFNALGSGAASSSAVRTTLWYLVCYFVGINVTWMLGDAIVALFESRVMRDLDVRSFEAVQSQSLRFFENSFAGSLVKSATRFRNAFEHIADAYFFQVGRGMLLVGATLVVLTLEQPILAAAFTLWTVLFLGVSFLVARIQFPYSEEEATADSAVGGAFADSFSNASAVKSFSKEHEELGRFSRIADVCLRKRIRAWLVSVSAMRVKGVVITGFELFLLWWLAHGWQQGTVTAGDFVFFQAYVFYLLRHLWDMSNIIHRLFQRFAEAKEVADIYVLSPEVRDAPGARPLRVEEAIIDFHAVNFSYVDQETRTRHDVHDFTLHIPARQSVALVGKSGAGKSTLVKLLLRHFDLTSGYIRIDGQDLDAVTQHSLREHVAIVPQQPELFHRTLRENIGFACPHATEEEIIAAAKRAHAWEFIQEFPSRLDTLVGERGVKLAGGERQRIALARAFLADAPILILDEATSALDSETEKLIQAAIADLLAQRTCIVIAHRLSTIMRMDRIVVMDEGSIVEMGTHTRLLEQSGVYARLWAHQIGGYLPQ